MSNKRNKKNAVVTFSSADEAINSVAHYMITERYRIDPYVDDSGLPMQVEELAPLIRKIWEDAYQAGRADARSDAAVEAAEAEWFNS